ncbi:MAG TPA: M28 family peptidase [Planctomycetota bacterium]|nr:M28 family peptidase [Planctomycetota bacterium]
MKKTVLVLGLLAAPVLAIEPQAAKEAAKAVDPARIGPSIDALCAPELGGRRAGTEGGKKTTALLAKAFADAGLAKLGGESSYVFDAGNGDENVLGVIAGSDLARESIVLSAHWDGVGVDEDGKVVPGADENASALSALLEMARVLGKTKPRRTLVFAAFGGWWDPKDDTNRWRGARAFLKKHRGTIHPVFQLDLMMLGVPLMATEPERFFALGSESSAPLIDVLKEAAAATTELKVARASVDLVEKRGPRDDYDAFRAAKVPFVFLTSGVSKHYHLVTDAPATLDKKRIAAAARLGIDIVARVDARDEAPEFAKESLTDDRRDATEVLDLVTAALDPKNGITFDPPSEKKALEFKRDKIKDMLDVEGELHLEKRDRGVLKETLELLLISLTHRKL